MSPAGHYIAALVVIFLAVGVLVAVIEWIDGKVTACIAHEVERALHDRATRS